MYRIPGNFPTPPSKAHVLGGMGTVDLRGGYGTYTLYTDQPPAEKAKGDIQLVRVQDLDLDGAPDTVNAILRGPPDQFHLEPGAVPGDGDYLAKGVTIHLAADRKAAVVEIGSERALLAQGEWSDWIARRLRSAADGARLGGGRGALLRQGARARASGCTRRR